MFDTSRTERLGIAAAALIVSGETGRMRSTPSADEQQRCRAWHVTSSTRPTGPCGAQIGSIKTEIKDLANPDPGTGIKEPTSTELEIRNGAGTPIVAEAHGAEPLAQPLPPAHLQMPPWHIRSFSR
jgi:hypothetical protein